MDRREQITRIIETVWFKGDPPEKNESNIRAAVKLAEDLEGAAPAAAPAPSAGASPAPQTAKPKR